MGALLALERPQSVYLGFSHTNEYTPGKIVVLI
jgi:hypothetical protein